MTRNPLIFEIKVNSLDDGPGIRTVIFFKGCPLSCVWCHNPEGKRAELEISFDKKVCIACNRCIEVCKAGALSRDNPDYVDREKCSLCFECIEECPSNALQKVGKELSVEEIFKEIAKYTPFYKNSGGGVTFSGGEATFFMEFASQLAQTCRANNIHVLLETGGLFNCDTFMEVLYPHINLIYYDIKILDPEQHKRYCGADNGNIIRNFVKLNKQYIEGGIEIIPRIPLIPGITATKANLEAIADFLRREKVRRVTLLPNNPLWGEKLDKLGGNPHSKKNDALYTWMKKEEIDGYHSIFSSFEIL